ncbi:DegT/DnrJ/EryC1/StrS family aminotransferase [Granulosicoccus sp. 3-233]|uniref:DegT/DnrJ/EryC1/StrS family aminotransferase n=1 Tax=Granulosicoccus sp. 3-233 TaxID=3417969 RepID=UPI003D353D8A
MTRIETVDSVPFNDLYRQYQSLKSEIDNAISSVIAQSAFVRGSQVEQFEESFAALIGVKHCVSCANGTDAIYVALRALGVGPGDEVITTAHTWISTAETISQTGAKVVFCDTQPDSFLMDLEDVARKITPKTKCIIPVHLFGQPVDMNALMPLAKKHNLRIIEDCAQAHLATFRGQQVGTFGDIATYSFYPGKNLGAMGDAGAIVTNDSELADWMALYCRHGGKGDHQLEGINSRMDGIQAAILSVKIPRLEAWTKRRVELAKQYDDALADVSSVVTPALLPERSHVYHLYVIKVENRDAVKDFLTKKGIATVINYPLALPNCKAYAYLGNSAGAFPNATENQGKILSLPIFPEMEDTELDYIVDALKASSAEI